MAQQLNLDLGENTGSGVERASQLCINLGELPTKCVGNVVRPVPEIVKDLFALSASSPSGLVWKAKTSNGKKAAGDPAGTRIGPKKQYFLVSVKGYGSFYAHRIVYFLRTGENPGSMVVRHLDNDELAVGFSEDNLRDEKGKCKKPYTGYSTARMYEYRNQNYNLNRLCKVLGIPYGKVYYKLRQNQHPTVVFQSLGIEGVSPIV